MIHFFTVFVSLLIARASCMSPNAVERVGSCVEGQRGIIVNADASCCRSSNLRLVAKAAKQDGVAQFTAEANDPLRLCIDFSSIFGAQVDGVEADVYLANTDPVNFAVQSLAVGFDGSSTQYAYAHVHVDDRRGYVGAKDQSPAPFPFAKASFSHTSSQSLSSSSSAADVLSAPRYNVLNGKSMFDGQKAEQCASLS